MTTKREPSAELENAANVSCSPLQPGQIIRPNLSDKMAIHLVEKLYGLKVESIVEQNSYDDKNYKITVADKWNNHHIDELWPHGYVFKVLNSMDSPKKHVDAEHEGEFILQKNGINCPIPILNVQRDYKSLEKIYSEADGEGCNNNEDRPFSLHICRLMKFVDGKILHSVPYRPALLYEAGVYLARIHDAWKDFDHPALHNHKTIWNLSSLPELKGFTYAVRNVSYKEMIHEILEAYKKEVIPLYGKFKEGIIHGDVNEQNIIVREKPEQDTLPPGERDHEIHGILDFGDSLHSYYVFDVAVAIMYLSIESKIVSPLLAGGYILAGYLSRRSLNRDEFDALKLCSAGRYAQSLVMGEYTYSIDPGNDYVLVTAKNGWPQLQELWATPKEKLYGQWQEIIDSYKTT